MTYIMIPGTVKLTVKRNRSRHGIQSRCVWYSVARTGSGPL